MKPINKSIKFSIIAIVSSIVIVFFIFQAIKITKNRFSSKNIEYTIKDTLQFKDSLLNKLYSLRIQHPYIVYAQAIVESGNFTSKLFRENKNMFGMKMPNSRVTTAQCIKSGYAYYNTWQDCVIDYALYQCLYLRNLNEEEYFKKLSDIYAEDLEYIRKVKQIKNKLFLR